jgi:catechol 2,3-dioxygenase
MNDADRPGSLAIPGLTHLNLNVADIERSRHFYIDVLGMTLQWEREGFLFLRSGEVDLGIIQRTPVEVDGMHFGFRLGSRADVDEWHRYLVAHRVGILEGPFDRDEGRAFFASDPDGYSIEFYFDG